MQRQLTVKSSFFDQFSIFCTLFLQNYWRIMKIQVQLKLHLYVLCYVLRKPLAKNVRLKISKNYWNPSKERYQAFKDHLTTKKTNNSAKNLIYIFIKINAQFWQLSNEFKTSIQGEINGYSVEIVILTKFLHFGISLAKVYKNFSSNPLWPLLTGQNVFLFVRIHKFTFRNDFEHFLDRNFYNV